MHGMSRSDISLKLNKLDLSLSIRRKGRTELDQTLEEANVQCISFEL